jgi:AAA ATPase domain/Bacterial regulatory proteins, luxR family
MDEYVLHGLEAERDKISAALAASRAIPAASCVRIAGLAGAGKTVLLRNTVSAAQGNGWFAASAGAHLVQERIPLTVVERLIDALGSQLEGAAPRYLPYIDGSKTAGAVEETFYRFIEGVLIDFPVLLAVDDVQWLDVESERVLLHAIALYADRPLALISTERGREPKRLVGVSAIDVPLGPLDGDAIGDIARSIDPHAPQESVAAIVQRSNGHPLTATILARESQGTGIVPHSVRSAISNRIESMEAVRREFLQLSALIEEPIDIRLLQKMLRASDSEIARLVEHSTPDFMTPQGEDLYFSHAAIAEGVRQTIPIDVPYRKRVLEALRAADRHSLGEYERISRQAAACGERVVERDALLSLARESLGQQAWSLAADAFARAFALSEPLDADFARSYTSYASALIANDQPLKAREVLESALEQGTRLQLERGFGELAAAYMAAIWYGEDFSAIPEVFARYIGRANSPGDRLALYAVLAFYRAGIMDIEAFEEAKRNALSQHADGSSAQSLQRVFIAEAYVRARLGNHTAAREAIARAGDFPDRRHPERATILRFSKAFVDHFEFGIEPLVRYAEEHSRADGDENNLVYDRYVSAYTSIARGEFDDALLTVEEALVRRIDTANRRRILSIEAAISSLRGEPSAYASLIEDAVASLFENENESVVPLAAWWASAIAPKRPRDARRIARAVAVRVRRPLQPVTLFLPLPLALYGLRANDAELLEEIAEGGLFEDSSRWYRAQSALARGIAATGLVRADASSLLKRAASELALLGAPLYSAIAASYAGATGADQQAVLAAAGVLAVSVGARLSPREAQIATLLSQGRSAVEIARALALSERIAEYNIERLRAKLAAEEAV